MSVNNDRQNTICIMPGCTRSRQHNGLCSHHNQQVLREWKEAHATTGVTVEQFTRDYARKHLAPSRLAQQERA